MRKDDRVATVAKVVTRSTADAPGSAGCRACSYNRVLSLLTRSQAVYFARAIPDAVPTPGQVTTAGTSALTAHAAATPARSGTGSRGPGTSTARGGPPHSASLCGRPHRDAARRMRAARRHGAGTPHAVAPGPFPRMLAPILVVLALVAEA